MTRKKIGKTPVRPAHFQQTAALVQALAVAEKRYPLAATMLHVHPDVRGVGVGLRERDGTTVDEAVFVVTVQEKRADLPAERQIPREVLGVGVDVQVAGPAQLAWPPAPGQVIRSSEGEPGRLGAFAVDDKRTIWGVTAMHVIAPTPPPAYFPPQVGARPTVSVSIDGVARPAGFLLESGRFDEVSDIAWLELQAPAAEFATLSARLEPLPPPVDVTSAHVGMPVGVLRGSVVESQGKVAAVLYGRQVRDTGRLIAFKGLVRFSLPLAVGDSGSLIVAENGAPIALLTFIESGGFACGFPIYQHATSAGRKLMGVS